MLTLGMLVIVLALGCGSSSRQEDLSGNRIDVVTTVGMVGDLVERVGGDRVSVQPLMGPGVDPHLYRATASDVDKLERADIVFYVGLELEGRMTEIFEKMTASGRDAVAVGERVPQDRLLQPKEFKGRYDPHLWFDVTLWKYALEAVRDALIERDPSSADLYRKNAEAYAKELDGLHAYVQEKIASIPENQRVLVTAHDAFGYFGRQYGLEVLGLQGTSTATEAGAGDVRGLAEMIARRGVKAIFVETSVPKGTIEALREAVRSRGKDVAIGGSLFSDAMGSPGTPAGTYVGMVRHNVDTIVEALQ